MKSRIGVDDFEEIDYHLERLEGRADDRLLTVQEICELLKVSKAYIYWLTHQKKIPFIKMQGHLRFRRSNIDRWLEEQEVRSGG